MELLDINQITDFLQQLVNSEWAFRFGVFLLLVLCFALAEAIFPRRRRIYTRVRRWTTNFGVLAVDLLVTTGLQSIAAVAAAFYAATHGWGVLNLLGLPIWASFLLTLVLLDLAIYCQHILFHKIPILWRMHRVHHADPELDVSSALRFHPLEIGLSVLYKSLIVLIIGAHPAATVVFAVILNGGAMFNHSNWKLPIRFDAVLRWFIVTPDMHRIHHSTLHNETDSNYGFNLSIWDRIFGTMRDQPRDGHEGMSIGLNDCPAEEATKLVPTLLLPLRKLSKRTDEQEH